ncbi:MAG: nitroreductase family deazaflavin-dependent oxidoreductase [Anaerolineales bacterium]|jgi:deazaflavin-dependent oxidoreductase (nitroreductase family)
MVEQISDVKAPSGFKRWLFRLPLAFYSAGLGWMLGSRFVRIEHTGRVTGKKRQVVLEVVDSDRPSGVFYVVAAWGDKADWFQNIRVNPKITYQVGRTQYDGFAEQVPREQAAQIFLRYGRKYPRMLQELMRFVGYRVEASEEAYQELADHLPVVRLSPGLERR